MKNYFDTMAILGLVGMITKKDSFRLDQGKLEILMRTLLSFKKNLNMDLPIILLGFQGSR